MSTQDFTPNVTFNQGLKISVETDQRGEAPSGNNSAWFQGGTWVDVVSDGLPSLYDQQALIFPAGHAGRRSMNQQAPVPGRKWSAGDINFNVTSEFLGLFLYGALGGASHSTTPGTTNALMAASAIEADAQTFSLTAQPSDSGAILQMALTGISGSGRLTVAGTDSYGDAASETISWQAEAPSATMYTRTSFSSVTGITINSVQTLGGSLAVNGIQYFQHDLFTATSNPTFSIERIGDPSAGATSVSFMHPAMVLMNINMNTPANSRDGIVSGGTTWEGDPTATCTGTALNDVSAIRIWPAWILSVTRDGTAYTGATNQTFTINTGNRNYRSAAGVQAPQGSFFGAREVTQSYSILLQNETEFNRWRGASAQNLVWTHTTPWKLTATQNQQMTASMSSTYAENVATGDDDGAFSYSADLRNIADATNDVVKFSLIDGIPPSAYGGSVVLN